MERFQSFFASRNVKLLLILFITVVIGLVSYYVRQQQELRGRASGTEFSVTINDANGSPLPSNTTNSKLVSLGISVPNNSTIQGGKAQAICEDPSDPECDPGNGGGGEQPATCESQGTVTCSDGSCALSLDGCRAVGGGSCNPSDSCFSIPFISTSTCAQHGGNCASVSSSCNCNPQPPAPGTCDSSAQCGAGQVCTPTGSGSFSCQPGGRGNGDICGNVCAPGSENCSSCDSGYCSLTGKCAAIPFATPTPGTGENGNYRITTDPAQPSANAQFKVNVVGSPAVANVSIRIADAQGGTVYPKTGDTPFLAISCSDGAPHANGCPQTGNEYKWSFTIPANKITQNGTYTAYFYKDNNTSTFLSSGNITVVAGSGGQPGSLYVPTVWPQPVVIGQPWHATINGDTTPLANVFIRVYKNGQKLFDQNDGGVVTCGDGQAPPTTNDCSSRQGYRWEFLVNTNNQALITQPTNATGSAQVHYTIGFGDNYSGSSTPDTNLKAQAVEFQVGGNSNNCPNGCSISKVDIENMDAGSGGDIKRSLTATSTPNEWAQLKQGKYKWNLVELNNGETSATRTVRVTFYDISGNQVSQSQQSVTYARNGQPSITAAPTGGTNPTVGPGTPTSTPIPTATTAPSVPTATSAPGTPTITPGGPTPIGGAGSTRIYLKLNLEGVGGAVTPVRLTPESVVVAITASGSAEVKTTGTVTFNTATRRFEGEVGFPDALNLATGQYKLVIKPASFLAQTYGIVQINKGQVNEMTYDAAAIIKSCDFNNDNKVDQLDLGALYSDLTLKAPTTTNATDINRNARVDVFDHNYCVQNFGKSGEQITL